MSGRKQGQHDWNEWAGHWCIFNYRKTFFLFLQRGVGMYIPIWLMWASVASIATVAYMVGSWVSNARNECACMDCENERNNDLRHENI